VIKGRGSGGRGLEWRILLAVFLAGDYNCQIGARRFSVSLSWLFSFELQVYGWEVIQCLFPCCFLHKRSVYRTFTSLQSSTQSLIV